MEFDYGFLRSRIQDRFKTQENFAKRIALSQRSLSLKLNNKVPFSHDEMARIAMLLDGSFERLEVYFFTPKVQ